MLNTIVICPAYQHGICALWHLRIGVFSLDLVSHARAACVTHETREYCHLKVDQLHIIIWKSKDTPFKPELATKD
jgi:hypothetical protein